MRSLRRFWGGARGRPQTQQRIALKRRIICRVVFIFAAAAFSERWRRRPGSTSAGSWGDWYRRGSRLRWKKGHVSSGKTVRDKRVPLSKVKQDELARRTCADADEAESTSTRGS